MRIRRTLPPILVLVVSALLGPPASAGGWDSLEFPKRHYLVGEVASTRDRFFAGRGEEIGRLAGGPYVASLLTATRNEGFGGIEPPTIPPSAIRLGTLSVRGPFRVPWSRGPQGRASLSFVVPDVPTGLYAIGFCDDPCVHASVGWLHWGLISIVHTPYEGLLLDRVARERAEGEKLRVVLHRSERETDDLRARLEALVERLRTRNAEATTPIELADAGPIVDVGPVDGPSVTWWIAILACIVGIGIGVAVARREREPAFVVPDTVPDDLESAIR